MKNFVLAVLCVVFAFGSFWPVQAQQQSCKLEIKAGDTPELEYYRLLGCLEGQLVLARQKHLATVPQLEGQIARLKGLQSVTAETLRQAMAPVKQSSTTTVTVTTVIRDTTAPVVLPQETTAQPGTAPQAEVTLTADTRQALDKFAKRQQEVLSGSIRNHAGKPFYTVEPNWQGQESQFRDLLALSRKSLDLEARFGHFVMDYVHSNNMTAYLYEVQEGTPNLEYLRAAGGYQFHYENGVLQRATANLYGGKLTLRRAQVSDAVTWKPGTIQYMLVWRNPAAYLPENSQRSTEEDERPLRDRYKHAASISMTVQEAKVIHVIVNSVTSSRLLKAYLGQNKYDVQVAAEERLLPPYNYTTYFVTLIPKVK